MVQLSASPPQEVATTMAVLKVSRASQDVWSEGDASLLERAVSNRVSNAIQHSDANSTIEIVLDMDSQVKVAVIDEGDFVGEFFLMWFNYIGVWILQPRINRIANDELETPTEKAFGHYDN